MNWERSLHLRALRAEPHCVYRAYARNDDLLYVGCTHDFEKRQRAHRYRAPWWHLVTRWETEWHPNFATARAVEYAAITSEHPIYNVSPKEIGRRAADARLAAKGQAA